VPELGGWWERCRRPHAGLWRCPRAAAGDQSFAASVSSAGVHMPGTLLEAWARGAAWRGARVPGHATALACALFAQV